MLKLGVLMIAVAGLSLTGCKKDKQNNLTPDSSSLQQLSKDENTVQDASDQTLDDVNTYLSNGNLKSTASIPCGLRLTQQQSLMIPLLYSLHIMVIIVTITRMRTGQVEIKKRVGMNWHEAGATVIVTLINSTSQNFRRINQLP